MSFRSLTAPKIAALVFSLSLCSATGQTDSSSAAQALPESPILGTVNELALTSPQQGIFCILTGGPTLSAGRKVVVIGERECTPRYGQKRERHYELAVNGKILYSEKKYVTIEPAQSDKIVTLTPTTPQEYIDKALQASRELRAKNLAKVTSAIQATRKFGLTILKARIADASEYTQGTNFSITLLNPTEKPIKYVTISVVGLNAVNDPVRDRLKGGPQLTVKAIGPIQTGEPASYKWEYMWHTDVVESFRISELRVEYMDKSLKTIRDWKAILLDPDLLELLEQED